MRMLHGVDKEWVRPNGENFLHPKKHSTSKLIAVYSYYPLFSMINFHSSSSSSASLANLLWANKFLSEWVRGNPHEKREEEKIGWGIKNKSFLISIWQWDLLLEQRSSGWVSYVWTLQSSSWSIVIVPSYCATFSTLFVAREKRKKPFNSIHSSQSFFFLLPAHEWPPMVK